MKQRGMRGWLGASLAVLLLGSISGCAYRLGPTGGQTAGARSVQVNLFRNDTLEPRLIEAMATALRRSLQQDGTFTLETHGDGDIVVDGVIKEYRRAALSFDPADIRVPRDLNLILVAHITARDRIRNEVLLDRDIPAQVLVRAGADLTSAEREMIPVLADDLARRITNLLADGTW